MKKKTKKKPKLSTAKKKAWDALSKAVRYSHAYDGDNCQCVTCLTVKHWKEMQGGHFEPKVKGTAAYFCMNPPNVHPQCYHCNMSLEGNRTEYYPYMINRYGEGAVELLKEKIREKLILRVHDYQDIEKHYKKEFERIEAMRKDGHTGIIDVVGY